MSAIRLRAWGCLGGTLDHDIRCCYKFGDVACLVGNCYEEPEVVHTETTSTLDSQAQNKIGTIAGLYVA